MRTIRATLFGAFHSLAVVAATGLVSATPAFAKSPVQDRFHEAFLRMDAEWPNISAHDYWLALKDAEDLSRSLSADEQASDADVARDLRAFDVYRRCWVALHAKEKAQSEFLVAELIMQDTPENAQAAREHFALAVASWDEAFRLWPYMRREKVRGDALAPSGEVQKNAIIGPGIAWRATAERRLGEVSSSK